MLGGSMTAKFTLALCALVVSAPAYSATISVDANGDQWEVFHYRNNAGPNSVGFGTGPELIFGAINVVPNPKGEDDGVVVSPFETTGVARQNGVEVDLSFVPSGFNPNQMAAGVDYDPNLTGEWEFTFTNGPDTLVVNTPSVGDIPEVDRVTNLRITSGANTTTPTFQWDPVAGAEDYNVSIYDLRTRTDTGFAFRLDTSGGDDPNDLIYTVQDGLLDSDGLYSFSIQSRILRDSGTTPSGTPLAGSALSQGRTFFDFTLVDLPGEGDLFLPEVDTSTGVPTFNFNNPVLANQIQFYDPLVAVGYDYEIGLGNPNFASFILPEIGDSLFDLYLYDDSISNYVFSSMVSAGDEYFFGTDGVDRFRILGIETGAGLNPEDPTAFVTGLSFVSSGQFTGTMKAITQEVDELTPVPVPPSIALLLGGFGLLAGGSRLKRRRS